MGFWILFEQWIIIFAYGVISDYKGVNLESFMFLSEMPSNYYSPY